LNESRDFKSKDNSKLNISNLSHHNENIDLDIDINPDEEIEKKMFTTT